MMLRIRQVVARQKEFEGFRSTPYLDTVGVWTIGYGSTTLFGRRVTETTAPVTDAEAEDSLKAHVLDAIAGCQRVYQEAFFTLDRARQEVLVHMAYQLGAAKLDQFTRMNAAIELKDYEGWAREMVDSNWWRQTPRPAKALRECVLDGEWSGEWVMR